MLFSISYSCGSAAAAISQAFPRPTIDAVCFPAASAVPTRFVEAVAKPGSSLQTIFTSAVAAPSNAKPVEKSVVPTDSVPVGQTPKRKR